MDGGILVPIALFAMIAAIVIIPKYFKSREREAVQEVVRAAIANGQNLPPETIEAITRDIRPVNSPANDVRRGVIWGAVAAGFAAFGWIMAYLSDEGDVAYVFLAFACIPGFVAAAYLVMAMVNKAAGPKKA